jgi:hypothetical protein
MDQFEIMYRLHKNTLLYRDNLISDKAGNVKGHRIRLKIQLLIK